jgi:hypothetical protein
MENEASLLLYPRFLIYSPVSIFDLNYHDHQSNLASDIWFTHYFPMSRSSQTEMYRVIPGTHDENRLITDFRDSDVVA